MTSPRSLTDLSQHFAFGENWANYAQTIDALRIEEARKGLVRLIGEGGLAGRTFLDLGCGSGLHTVAAAREGVVRAVAVDIDPVAVRTAARVLREHAPELACKVREHSVFDLSPDTFGLFDVVYSWGVLHHSGAMRAALAAAARVVAPGGLFAFALYRQTLLCRLWRREKRWYAGASPRAQAYARSVYIALLRLRFLATGGDFQEHVASYQSLRGMNFISDIHDWMGGYPYESISPPEVDELMRGHGFKPVRSFTFPKSIGFFGSGCDEYLYRRAP
jgi:2-polyprenyl-6-hydroxyphenyl methylase/3-demethylubiquinone-9 3-methyltransferase